MLKVEILGIIWAREFNKMIIVLSIVFAYHIIKVFNFMLWYDFNFTLHNRNAENRLQKCRRKHPVSFLPIFSLIHTYVKVRGRVEMSASIYCIKIKIIKLIYIFPFAGPLEGPTKYRSFHHLKTNLVIYMSWV